MTDTAQFALIIPAHNEEAVIARCLQSALSGAPNETAVEVIVAANGCTDQTVEKARQAAPSAHVLNLGEGSKTKAINAANEIAKAYPRIVLDADVECSFDTLFALAQVLRQPEVMVAAPAIRLELSHGNRFIKAYYAAWMKQPFAKAGKGGAGCYGLSQEGLKAAGPFPQIIGDDIWIHTRFPDEQRRYVRQDEMGAPIFSVVRPPSTAWDQVKVEARRMLGNAEVKQNYPSPHFENANAKGGIRGLMRSGVAPLDLLVFIAVKILVRLQMRILIWRGDQRTWTRDQSSRQQSSPREEAGTQPK